MGTSLTKENDLEPLKILSFNPNISINGINHHTDKYQLMTRSDPRLVVRRGESFYVSLKLSREFNVATDAIFLNLILKTESMWQYKKVNISIPVKDSFTSTADSWRSRFIKTGESSLQIQIIPSCRAAIGQWKLGIKTSSNGSDVYLMDNPFYIIFNPWCIDDEVYLPGEEERKEYVMNEIGLIWKGSCHSFNAISFQFGQFEEDILDCIFHILFDIGKFNVAHRNDPVAVSRRLSAVVNARDDNGVLVGNWGKQFPPGTKPPNYWTGSKEILQQYYHTRKPVKYGQCWVFAGILTTACRALGIPSRVVTNFESAHDTDLSLTIDVIYNLNEESFDEDKESRDSVWNFHVWNEVWMARKDLSKDYDGWQALDSTPQELSGNKYRCGPASVAAIKRGETDINQPYDNAFIYAEINADIVHWLKVKKQRQVLQSDTESVGQFISTKAIGTNEREDITHMYKHPEGSLEERATMMKALGERKSQISTKYRNAIQSSSEVEIKSDLCTETMIGKSFSFKIYMKNKSTRKAYSTTIFTNVYSIGYTGKVEAAVKKSKATQRIEPNSNKEINTEITWDEYASVLRHSSVFKIQCLVAINDIDCRYSIRKKFSLTSPQIHIEIGSDAFVGTTLSVIALFTNPLPVPIEEGAFSISGLKNQKCPFEIELTSPVRPGGLVKCHFMLATNYEGEEHIIVKFNSMYLDHVEGVRKLIVRKK